MVANTFLKKNCMVLFSPICSSLSPSPTSLTSYLALAPEAHSLPIHGEEDVAGGS
jgi:hypothetical protein